MTSQATIEIPRLENERAERYQARTLYTTMGPDRNLRAVAQQLDKSLTIVGRWSSEDDWPALAAGYDQTLGNLAARDASEAYRRDLEDHRKKAMDSGEKLYTLAMDLMSTISTKLRGQVIEGRDGKKYTIPAMKIDQGAIMILARTLTTSLDLQAHALRLGDILPKLDGGEDAS